MSKLAQWKDLEATAKALGQYACYECMCLWKFEEVPEDFQEHEGCQQCMWHCERCGMVRDSHGSFEHCL